MKITLVCDVKLVQGRNYPQDEVADLLVEEMEAELPLLWMPDQADTHHIVDVIKVVRQAS